MRTRHKVVADSNYYFITSSTSNHIPLFFNDDLFCILLQSFIYCQKSKGLRLYAYVIMPNHFHAVISHEEAEAIPVIMRDLKKFTSKQLRKYINEKVNTETFSWLKPFVGEKGVAIWQEGYHPQALFNMEVLMQKIEYIHSNPVKKGYVLKPEDWKYSSARNFVLEDSSLIALDSGW